MKIAYFDCQFGAAGDMLVASLIDAGLPIDLWLAELKKIALPESAYKVSIEDVTRCTLASKKVSVLIAHNHGYVEEGPVGTHLHLHDHDHHDHHHHDHEHSHSSATLTHQKEHHGRGLSEIKEIIEKSNISAKAKSLANAIFYQLAKAEGIVHGLAPEKIHFHEVGAIDAIVDIIGFAIGYDLLQIEKSIVSPLPLSHGTVTAAHGTFPLPPPAVSALLKEAQAPVRNTNFTHECLTPTGAAILTTIANEWGNPPTMDKIHAIGYGAGNYNPENYPNVSRVILGESSDSSNNRFKTEQIIVLETNLDDLSPQILSFTSEQLLKLGALDVFIMPCLMKKGRSGHLLTVLCEPNKSNELQEFLLLQTSTLGVRKYLTERLSAEREWQNIKLNDQSIRIKIARDLQGKIIHAQPEYEDCAAYAKTTGLPLQDIIEQALAKFRQGEKI